MPFAGYADFDDCIAQNQDKDDPGAYCAAIQRAVEGASVTDKEKNFRSWLTGQYAALTHVVPGRRAAPADAGFVRALSGRETCEASFVLKPDVDLAPDEFMGIASMFGRLIDAVVPTRVLPGAFTRTLKDNANRIVILWHHDEHEPIGRPTLLEETDIGLLVRAKISQTPAGQKALTLLRDGVVRELSIGFDPVKWEIVEEEGRVVRLIKDVDLWEISPVTFAANPGAVITAVHERLRTAWREHQDMRDRAVTSRRIPRRETVRWNQQLPAAFDITAQEFAPQSVEQAMAAQYCGCPIKTLHHEHWRIPSVRMGAFLLALEDQLSRTTVEDVRNLDDTGHEAPPLYETIQLTSTRHGEFLVDGLRFLQADGVKLALRVEARWFGLMVTGYAARSNAAAVQDLIERTQRHALDLKLLRGEAFALSGEFLPRGTESFDDLFLSEVNAGALRRVVTLINQHGAAADNRGVLLVGPPGTGKTLSGRVVMNHAKATFIWVAARDFYYGGGFRSMDDAFELAAEYAPTVLFLEDVDSYLDHQTVDLLKTTMDGLVQTKGITTILTSNFPEQLPEAIIDRPGRFHDVLSWGLPDETVRDAMFRRWMPELSDAERAGGVKATAGYSGAHIRELARFAYLIAEQDGLSATAALAKALDKLRQQRDLITAVQGRWSQYRPPAHVIASMEQFEGRMLSAENEAALNESILDLQAAMERITALLAKHKGNTEPDKSDVVSYDRDRDELELQYLGVQAATL